MHIRKNDKVRVIAGNDRGKVGQVLKVFLDSHTIIVEKVHLIKRHMKRSQAMPQGGILEKEAPNTVANFIGLATGTKKWTHPITGAESDKPIYNNTTIYQTVRNVLVRGGDPVDKGMTEHRHEIEVFENLPLDALG